MRNIKYIIPIIILFLTVGFAAVNSSLSMTGDTVVTSDIDDFNVYFSRALVNGEIDEDLVVSATELNFSTLLEELGNTYIITYDVTNASSGFDAELTIECSDSNDYLLITNEFDNSTNLEAKGTRTGTLVLKKTKTNANAVLDNEVSCSIKATPVERNSITEGEVYEEIGEVMTIFFEDGHGCHYIKEFSNVTWEQLINKGEYAIVSGIGSIYNYTFSSNGNYIILIDGRTVPLNTIVDNDKKVTLDDKFSDYSRYELKIDSDGTIYLCGS